LFILGKTSVAISSIERRPSATSAQPSLKLIEAGAGRDDLRQLLMINCRTPELLDGSAITPPWSVRSRGSSMRSPQDRWRHCQTNDNQVEFVILAFP